MGETLSRSLTTESVSTEIAQQVLGLLYRYRRVDESLEAESGDSPSMPCDACFEARVSRLAHFISRHEEIHFVIPAFPAKSPNRSKVLGSLPDLGEYLALSFLQALCDYIGHFYASGARVTICSDGHVFADVVGVTDDAVTAYRANLTSMISAANWKSLDLFGLDDAFGSLHYPRLRQVLEENYASTIGELKQRTRTEDSMRALFNGIHRFMFEDALGTRGAESSRTKLRQESKEAAYQTIRRSNAWSRMVAERFPGTIRLSIHPQPPHSEKFGLRLMRTKDGWLTPWHAVVLDDGVHQSLVRRWEAEQLNASVVWRNGRPSHFIGPHLTINS
ncbi:MAG TPA: isocyanide synthase family protein [Pseudonocardiaceae bacterium]